MVIDLFERARTMTSLAWVLSQRNKTNDMETAIKVVDEAESIWERLAEDGFSIDICSRTVTAINKGIIFHHAGRTSEGIAILKSALAWLDPGDVYQRKQIVDIHLNISNIYRKMSNRLLQH